MKVEFVILGKPQSKERPNFNRRMGIAYTPIKTVAYEDLIRTEYLRQCPGQRFADKEPLAMKIRAYYTIPASASKVQQRAMEAGEIRPTKKPDADNIIKVVADALNKLAYRDDADLVLVELEKFYSNTPRLVVTIKDFEG